MRTAADCIRHLLHVCISSSGLHESVSPSWGYGQTEHADVPAEHVLLVDGQAAVPLCIPARPTKLYRLEHHGRLLQAGGTLSRLRPGTGMHQAVFGVVGGRAGLSLPRQSAQSLFVHR